MIYVTLFIIILLIVYFIYKNGKLLLLKYDKEYLNELIKNDRCIMEFNPLTTFSTDFKTDKNIMWVKNPNVNSKTITISKNEN